MELVRLASCHAPSQLFNISQLIGGNEALKLRLIVGTNRTIRYLRPSPSLIWLPAISQYRVQHLAQPHSCVSAPAAVTPKHSYLYSITPKCSLVVFLVYFYTCFESISKKHIF